MCLSYLFWPFTIIHSWLTEIFTNQTGLTYTLTNVWQQRDSGVLVKNENLGAPLSSLTYLNNPIRSCVINTLQIDMESEDRSGAQYGFAMWGQNVQVKHPKRFQDCGVTN